MADIDHQRGDHPEKLIWHWDDNNSPGEITVQDDRFVFLAPRAGGAPTLRRIGPQGNLLWEFAPEVTIENEAALAVHAGRLYAALYARGATGCRVLALEVSSGSLVWDVSLEGLGSVGHSKYSNRVQLRAEEDQVFIYGKEAAGRYVEVLDSSDGQQRAHRVIS